MAKEAFGTFSMAKEDPQPFKDRGWPAYPLRLFLRPGLLRLQLLCHLAPAPSDRLWLAQLKFKHGVVEISAAQMVQCAHQQSLVGKVAGCRRLWIAPGKALPAEA